jgi:hypothetical protein
MSSAYRRDDQEFRNGIAKRAAELKREEKIRQEIDAATPEFVKEWNKTLGTFQNRSTAWWWSRIVREFLTQCGEEVWEFITRRAEALVRLAKAHLHDHVVREPKTSSALLGPLIAASRTPLWPLSGWGCRGQRPSRG